MFPLYILSLYIQVTTFKIQEAVFLSKPATTKEERIKFLIEFVPKVQFIPFNKALLNLLPFHNLLPLAPSIILFKN